MSNKILSITEKKPQSTTLPDGHYSGNWGGRIIEVSYNGKIYELTTEEGVRGINIKVIVVIREGIATFSTIKN